MTYTILVTKETRAGERRVSLIPVHIKQLCQRGHHVFVEHNAGQEAGFTDAEYQLAGADIRFLENTHLSNYQKLFADINLIVRAKRPERTREIIENQTIANGTIMVGALDPLENHSSHIAEYKQAGIIAYSLDQLNLPEDHPMNILSAMSKLAGKLALLDAIKKISFPPKKVVLLGFGTIGRSALQEALQQQLSTSVIMTNPDKVAEVERLGANTLLLNRHDDLTTQQAAVRAAVLDADIVITSARKPNQSAPLLIPLDTLNNMKQGSVVIDLALSEGGNVAGSEHDVTNILGNGVIVSNVSGYPKAVPHEASVLWSQASLEFITQLTANQIKNFL